VQLLASRWDGPADLHVQRLPVTFAGSGPALEAALAEVAPDIVVCVGLAGGDPDIRLETVAINLDDARIPDNAGAQPVDEPAVAGAPAAYFGSLPVKAAVAAIRERGIPARVSHTAGTFVCNHAFYLLMRALESRPGMRGGFVHVPYAAEAVAPGIPSLALDAIADALDVVVRTAIARGDDLRAPGGTLS
jgi:pyroglutamyl-peptidase